jgi:hypothetical protein
VVTKMTQVFDLDVLKKGTAVRVCNENFNREALVVDCTLEVLTVAFLNEKAIEGFGQYEVFLHEVVEGKTEVTKLI